MATKAPPSPRRILRSTKVRVRQLCHTLLRSPDPSPRQEHATQIIMDLIDQLATIATLNGKDEQALKLYQAVQGDLEETLRSHSFAEEDAQDTPGEAKG